MPKGVYDRSFKDPILRFMSHVKKEKNGCWVWMAYKLRGYGYFSIKTSRSILAHRFSYEHLKGCIPEGTEIDHLCRNRACVNPYHLEAVSHQENIRRGTTGFYMRKKSQMITHCPKGHEYTLENTYLHKGKYKQCRKCKLKHQKLARDKERKVF